MAFFARLIGNSENTISCDTSNLDLKQFEFKNGPEWFRGSEQWQLGLT